MANSITLPVRRIRKTVNGFVVQERTAVGRWKKVSNYYNHTTSAYAALGRMTARAGA